MTEYRLIEISNSTSTWDCDYLEYYSYIAFRNRGILREATPIHLFENPKVFENRKTNWEEIFSLRALNSPEETIEEITKKLVQNGFHKEDLITTEKRQKRVDEGIERIIPSEERVRLGYLEDEIKRRLK